MEYSRSTCHLLKKYWLSLITLGMSAVVKKSVINGVYLGFASFILIISIICSLSLYNVRTVNNSINTILNTNIHLHNKAQEIENYFHSVLKFMTWLIRRMLKILRSRERFLIASEKILKKVLRHS